MQDKSNKYSAQVKQEQIRLLFRQSPFLFFIATSMMLAVAYIFWDHTDRTYLLMWLGVSLVYTFLRIIFIKSFHRNKPQHEAVLKWGKIFALTSFASGLLWGSIAFIFVDTQEIESAVLVVIVLAGVSTGSLSPLSAYLAAYIGFNTLALTPFIALMLSESSGIFPLLGYLTIALFFVNFAHSFAINQNIINSIQLRFENLDLLSHLEIEKEVAEKANKDKSRFLAAASHDLRQPLHAMDLYLGALKNILTSDDQQSLLNKSQLSSNSLSELLNSLMDVSQLDSGNVSINEEIIDVHGLLNDICQSMLPQAQKSDIDLNVDAENIYIFSDPVLLGRVLRNFITNAIRHSGCENINLCATKNNDMATISVSDDGKGIESAELENIFSEFYQLNNPERDRAKGLGLGLAIVDRIANQLDYKLDVQSPDNKGIIFSLHMPAVDPEKEVEREIENEEVEKLAGLLIIVIEDEADVRDAMRLLLRSWDCEVLAEDSLEAVNAELDQLEYPVPDIIVSDYRLREGKTGMEAINALWKRFDKKVPAIVITGDTTDDVAANISAEQCELIHKPVRPDDLKNIIVTLAQG